MTSLEQLLDRGPYPNVFHRLVEIQVKGRRYHIDTHGQAHEQQSLWRRVLRYCFRDSPALRREMAITEALEYAKQHATYLRAACLATGTLEH